ncbi:catabolite repression protein crec [Moniliophthora roreri MCA 2997]|uniref:Catabolite repression protein crec n=1 Tax=Moniliophthora roreri (strain MCA 2997) TaxID=1381753 RepID=V2XKC4_MONRO|nr:catabolite repression protein crec [Moniliophthora roreri MCA 2997]
MENEATFVAPEGVYTVVEEHKPSVLQAHAASSAAVHYPTRVTAITVRFPAAKQSGGTPGFAQLLGGNKDSRKEKEKPAREDGVSLSSSDTPDETENHSEPGNPSVNPHLFSSHSVGAKKKTANSRPKHNIKTTSSTFITRIQYAEGYAKLMQSKQGETSFLFYNQVKTLLWIEAGIKAKEPLARITFSAHPTCHDVNPLTASHDRLDVIVGFSTGDLIWLDPISSRYARLNKQGCITSSPCTAVRWVPSSTSLFLVSHADGTIVVYDREREDGTFTPSEPGPSHTNSTGSANGSDSHTSSEESWDPMDNIFVTMPPWHPVGSGAKSDKDKAASLRNPVSHWRVSKKSVVDFVFSNDVKYVGAISEDGCLRIIDALAEQLIDCYASYFGALTCVAWSPDGRFIVTGGQDDLLTIFSPWEQRVVARCQGHSSFVSSVAFDDLRCDGRTYRFGSVGEDNKLILWDFSCGALHRPKLQSTYHQRISMSSTLSLAFRKDRSAFHLPSLNTGDGNTPIKYHPAPSRNEIAVVQPVLVKHIDGELLAALTFVPRHLVTSTKNGHLKLWIRPLALRTLKGKRSPQLQGNVPRATDVN